MVVPDPHEQRHATSDTSTAVATGRRIAIAHDWLCGYRGGEGVLDRIVRLVAHEHEPAGLYVMFDDRTAVTPTIDAQARVVSGIGRLPWASTGLRRWLFPLYPRAVEDLSRRLAEDHARRPIDLLISTSSAAIKGLRPPTGVPHLCYIHTPARYVWSQRAQYAGSPLRALGLRLFADRFAAWDKRTAGHVTRFLANSAYTAQQVRLAYGRDAKVLYPPVRTEFFTPRPTGESRRRGQAWLVASALEPYKRVDLALDAASTTSNPLWIVGTGSQRRVLGNRSGPTATFLGRVTDERLRDLYRRASVLLCPQIEDFGISAVEAQACGMPVVARRTGGACDTVIDGVTGALFDEPEVGALLDAIARCPRNPDACRENAERFSTHAFDDGLRDAIAELVG